MRRFLVLALGLTLVAAACNNKAAENNNPTPPPAQNPAPSPSPANPNPSPAPTPAAPTAVTITFTDDGYSPNNVTIKKGTKVTFVNNSSKNFWPASAPHPSHTDYPEFDPKKGIAAGESWAFTFDKTGTWRFHDHLTPTKFGSITVTE